MKEGGFGAGQRRNTRQPASKSNSLWVLRAVTIEGVFALGIAAHRNAGLFVVFQCAIDIRAFVVHTENVAAFIKFEIVQLAAAVAARIGDGIQLLVDGHDPEAIKAAGFAKFSRETMPLLDLERTRKSYHYNSLLNHVLIHQ